MPKIWGPTRERQYEHILSSCWKKTAKRPCPTKACAVKRLARCKRIAAATVNRDRTRFCETKAGCPAR